MATEFRTVPLTFPEGQSSTGEATVEGQVEFSTNVLEAEAAIKSWDIHYGDADTQRFHKHGL